MKQEEVIEIVKSNNPLHFKKSGEYNYFIVQEQQEVITSIAGEVETKNTAEAGDYILIGASGEKYVLKPATFQKRYDDFGNGFAKAKGECWGNIYRGESISFTAPWGEEMICNDGDYLVSPNAEFSEAYRIEFHTFVKSYQLA